MQLRLVAVLALVSWSSARAWAATPSIVKDIDMGSVPGVFTEMVESEGGAFFTLAADEWGDTLWHSDGTAEGTRQLLPDPYRSRVSTLRSVNGLLFFSYVGARGALEAWRSDGTAAGTIPLATVYGDGVALDDDEAHALYGFVAADGGVFFAACLRFRQCTLWATDGTQTGTRPLVEFNPDVDRDTDDWDAPVFDVVDGTLRFTVGDSWGHYALWQSNGTPAGTTPLTGMMDGPAPDAGAPPFYYAGTDRPDLGWEPWRYDPVTGTRELVKDIVPGPGGSSPIDFTAVGESVFFVTLGPALWKTDGTSLGTVPVAALSPTMSPSNFVGARGMLFFMMGSAVWRSDGTAEGTIALVDLGPSPEDFSLLAAAVDGGWLLSAYGVDGQPALWRTDGTPSGTHRVIGVPQFPAASWPSSLAGVGNRLLFTILQTPEHGVLWASDGSAAGTVPVANVWAGQIVDVGGTAFFSAKGPSGRAALWTSDGTTAGTRPVVDPLPDGSWWPDRLTRFAGNLFFRSGSGLWRSDGTAAGTTLVAPLWQLYRLFPTDGGKLFVAVDTPDLRTDELWMSDGTSAGTVRVATVPGSIESGAAIGADVFFILGRYGINGSPYELWKSDGTADGTARVVAWDRYVGDLTAIGSRLFMTVDGLLWTSDGTATGTVAVAGAPRSDAIIGGMNGHLLFSVLESERSVGLWRTDGTAAGTARVGALPPGWNLGPWRSSGPPTLVRGTLFFGAGSADYNTELWSLPLCDDPILFGDDACHVLPDAPAVPDQPSIVEPPPTLTSPAPSDSGVLHGDGHGNNGHASGVPACAGELGTQRLQRRLDRSRALLDRAAAAAHPRTARRLLRRAKRSIRAVTASLADGRRSGLSRDCAAALGGVTTDVARGVRSLRAARYSRP